MAFKPWTLTLPCPKCGGDLTFACCDEPDPDVGIFGYAMILLGHAEPTEECAFSLSEVEALEGRASEAAWQGPPDPY